MDCFEHIRGGYDAELNRLHERRDTLIRTIRGFVPPNPEDALEEGSDEIELNWVRVPDPRQPDGGVAFEVLPVLPVEWIEDDSGYGSLPGVEYAAFYGRLPSGDESLIGVMGLEPASMHDTNEVTLQLRPETHPTELTRWDSADAELFLTMAEAAMRAQPAAPYLAQ